MYDIKNIIERLQEDKDFLIKNYTIDERINIANNINTNNVNEIIFICYYLFTKEEAEKIYTEKWEKDPLFRQRETYTGYH